MRLKLKRNGCDEAAVRAFFADPEVSFADEPGRHATNMWRVVEGYEMNIEVADTRALCKLTEAAGAGAILRLPFFPRKLAAQNPALVATAIEASIGIREQRVLKRVVTQVLSGPGTQVASTATRLGFKAGAFA